MYRHQFCELVTGQLRCKWEAPAVRQELADHIQDHQAALMAEAELEVASAAARPAPAPESRNGLLGRLLGRFRR